MKSNSKEGKTDMKNIFETATRKKLRFPSDRGDLSTEQLWDLTLPDLDAIARDVNKALKGVTEESFLDTSPHPDKPRFTLQLNILKHVIDVKQTEAQAMLDRAKRAEKRRKLTEALEVKDDQAIQKKSRAALEKELAELDDD